MFRVYSGPPGSRLNAVEKSRHLYKIFGSLDEAVDWAHQVRRKGRTALLIEGDDGTHLDRQDLAKVLHHRESERHRAV